jgi:hypothetical protein
MSDRYRAEFGCIYDESSEGNHLLSQSEVAKRLNDLEANLYVERECIKGHRDTEARLEADLIKARADAESFRAECEHQRRQRNIDVDEQGEQVDALLRALVLVMRDRG